MDSQQTWIEPPAGGGESALVRQLAAERELPLALARVLWVRGHRDSAAIERLLDPRHEHLLDPFLMAGMTAASERLARAVDGGEHIVVNGDYDADGVTGTALLVSNLRALGAHADFFIPDRERDGYGITPRLVRRAAEVGVGVLLSVDCGSSDHAAIEEARSLGIDVVVIDHHEVPDPPAAAHTVLNPKRSDCAYPFKGLSAVGVGYKLLQAVGEATHRGDRPSDGLDFVALGTLADAQPVVGENRTLVALGLRRLTEQPRPGIRALRAAAGVLDTPVGSRTVGWRLVPRLNAVGRVARGKLAVDLLLAADEPTARRLAADVESRNRWRQTLEQGVVRQALERAEALQNERSVAALVLASPEWHPGVVGIAAARLTHRFGIPAAVIGIQNGVGRGSVRSPGAIDVRAALDAASDLLVKHGGHREAAGFTIEPVHVPEFTARFEAAVRAQGERPREATLALDVEIDPEEVDGTLLAGLERLEPFGPGNAEPLFLLRGLRIGSRTRLVGEGHLKLELCDRSGSRTLGGIAFGRGRTLRPADALGQEVDVAAHLRRQDPRWGESPQLVVVDLRTHVPRSAAPEDAQ
jgi:single-stranded-DNA-specific exonuclease